jgi:hypothetical protein
MIESATFQQRTLAEVKSNSLLIYTAILFACLATFVLFVLHPNLAIRDADGFAYIMGARSLHDGNGYQSLIGEPLNHWPPGYSLLLSPFKDSIFAATIINYCSFGATVGLIYYLLRRSAWSWQAAFGLTLVLASGFLRLLANSAHADVLTYAVFLAGICAATHFREIRFLPSLIWASLIPVKYIAVVFLPAAFGADLFVSRWDWRRLLRSYGPGVVVGGCAVAVILIFNILTIHVWMSSSHQPPSLETLMAGARSFVVSFPREFLFNWHGSISEPFPRVAFPVCLVLAVICLISLRPSRPQNWFLVYGLLCVGCSGLLLGVRSYIPTNRLVGYGLIVLFFGFRPSRWANPFWLIYGFASVAVAVVNALTVNSLGSMDPRYADLASQVRDYYKGSGTIATNSFHILDLNAKIPSTPVEDSNEAANYDTFLWVTLPTYDPGSSAVTPVARPGRDWCEQKQFAGGVLFTRCQHRQR